MEGRGMLRGWPRPEGAARRVSAHRRATVGTEAPHLPLVGTGGDTKRHSRPPRIPGAGRGRVGAAAPIGAVARCLLLLGLLAALLPAPASAATATAATVPEDGTHARLGGPP